MQKWPPLFFSVILPACLFLTSQAEAASFDCAKAKSDIEKAICNDPELSLLDERLAKAYQAALNTAQTSDSIKSGQQQWLADVRDKCQDKTCLQLAYQARTNELSRSINQQWPLYRDQELGIELSYPPERQISKNCHDSKLCVALVEEKMPAGSDYLLAFEVFDGNLQQVAANQAIFSRQSGGWMAKGRNGTYPALYLAGEGWEGIYAVVDCGITDSEGFFHAAAGECFWAVLSNGNRSVVIDSQGLVGNDTLSQRTIESFKFIR